MIFWLIMVVARPLLSLLVLCVGAFVAVGAVVAVAVAVAVAVGVGVVVVVVVAASCGSKAYVRGAAKLLQKDGRTFLR